MPFREQIKPLWDQSELTLSQLAEICNISESSASRYLNGKVVPPVDVAEKIIAVLGGENKTKEGQEMQSMVQHIREVYEAQINTLQAQHAAQVASLQKDKQWLAIFVVVLFVVLIYLFIDCMHGDWGMVQYPVA